MQPSPKQIATAKAAVFVLALVPLGWLATGAIFFPDWLTANPGEFLDRQTGRWTLRFLLITLAVTPLRALTGWNWLLRFRRMLGLFAFFYGVMHLSSYVAFRRFFDLSEILKDLAERPFMTAGFTALVLMIPLAVTSTNAMVRRLGARRWQLVHRLVYVIASLGALHYWFMVKRDVTQPAIYAAILAVLLGWRLVARLRGRQRAMVTRPSARQGYRAIERGGVGADGGIELELRAKDKTFVVRCKRWKARTVERVRDLYGAMTGERAHGASFVTSSGYTPDAIDFARDTPIKLVDRGERVEMLRGAQSSTRGSDKNDPPQAPVVTTVAGAMTCPRCGSAMVERVAKRGAGAGGEFRGCSRFPACRGTQAS